MGVNPMRFDKHGLIQLGTGLPTDAKWHPLYAEHEGYHYLTASYSTGEIKLFAVKEQGRGGKPELKRCETYRATDNHSPCYSPDGHYVVGGYGDGRLRMFDVYTNKRVAGFGGRGHTSLVSSVSFSPDGRFIISGSDDHTVLIWYPAFIIGGSWREECLNSPLALTGVWFPDETLPWLQQTKQGVIVEGRPLARCGSCNMFFPVADKMRGKEIRCPRTVGKWKCNRLIRVNEFTAGVER